MGPATTAAIIIAESTALMTMCVPIRGGSEAHGDVGNGISDPGLAAKRRFNSWRPRAGPVLPESLQRRVGHNGRQWRSSSRRRSRDRLKKEQDLAGVVARSLSQVSVIRKSGMERWPRPERLRRRLRVRSRNLN